MDIIEYSKILAQLERSLGVHQWIHFVWVPLIGEKAKFHVFWFNGSFRWSPPDHLLLDSAFSIGPLISCWELDKFKNFWNKSFRSSKIMTLLYQQFSNFLISQRDMNVPRLGALSNNRWSGVLVWQFWAPAFTWRKICNNWVNGQHHQRFLKILNKMFD
jgi:hypothetical protein